MIADNVHGTKAGSKPRRCTVRRKAVDGKVNTAIRSIFAKTLNFGSYPINA
jgi:uncharacterized protein YggU (UPF0235/DUF167 family)